MDLRRTNITSHEMQCCFLNVKSNPYGILIKKINEHIKKMTSFCCSHSHTHTNDNEQRARIIANHRTTCVLIGEVCKLEHKYKDRGRYSRDLAIVIVNKYGLSIKTSID